MEHGSSSAASADSLGGEAPLVIGRNPMLRPPAGSNGPSTSSVSNKPRRISPRAGTTTTTPSNIRYAALPPNTRRRAMRRPEPTRHTYDDPHQAVGGHAAHFFQRRMGMDGGSNPLGLMPPGAGRNPSPPRREHTQQQGQLPHMRPPLSTRSDASLAPLPGLSPHARSFSSQSHHSQSHLPGSSNTRDMTSLPGTRDGSPDTITKVANESSGGGSPSSLSGAAEPERVLRSGANGSEQAPLWRRRKKFRFKYRPFRYLVEHLVNRSWYIGVTEIFNYSVLMIALVYLCFGIYVTMIVSPNISTVSRYYAYYDHVYQVTDHGVFLRPQYTPDPDHPLASTFVDGQGWLGLGLGQGSKRNGPQTETGSPFGVLAAPVAGTDSRSSSAWLPSSPSSAWAAQTQTSSQIQTSADTQLVSSNDPPVQDHTAPAVTPSRILSSAMLSAAESSQAASHKDADKPSAGDLPPMLPPNPEEVTCVSCVFNMLAVLLFAFGAALLIGSVASAIGIRESIPWLVSSGNIVAGVVSVSQLLLVLVLWGQVQQTLVLYVDGISEVETFWQFKRAQHRAHKVADHIPVLKMEHFLENKPRLRAFGNDPAARNSFVLPERPVTVYSALFGGGQGSSMSVQHAVSMAPRSGGMLCFPGSRDIAQPTKNLLSATAESKGLSAPGGGGGGGGVVAGLPSAAVRNNDVPDASNAFGPNSFNAGEVFYPRHRATSVTITLVKVLGLLCVVCQICAALFLYGYRYLLLMQVGEPVAGTLPVYMDAAPGPYPLPRSYGPMARYDPRATTYMHGGVPLYDEAIPFARYTHRDAYYPSGPYGRVGGGGGSWWRGANYMVPATSPPLYAGAGPQPRLHLSPVMAGGGAVRYDYHHEDMLEYDEPVMLEGHGNVGVVQDVAVGDTGFVVDGTGGRMDSYGPH